MDQQEFTAQRGLLPVRQPHRWRATVFLSAVAAGALALATLIGCGSVYLLTPSDPVAGSSVSPIPGSPIKHIVIIMQENRSFDNLFNGFPGADTVQSGMNGAQQTPLAPIGLDDPRDLDHSHTGWWQDWDNGKMDGFAGGDTGASPFAYSYVREQDVEPYWLLAKQYVLGDRMFQSNTGPSFVAHEYMIAGQSAKVVENPTSSLWGCDAEPGTTAALIGPNGTELPGVFPCFDYKTIGDLLDEKGVTWRYYAPPMNDAGLAGSAYDAIRHIRYGKDWTNNVIVPQTKVLVDIAQGELAQVTWIIPDSDHSDHPGTGSKEGPDWVASIVNAIGASPFWDSTAVFIAWDDWGGFYDHVAPASIDDMGPGFRVPVLVVSPWAKHGFVTHRVHEASGFISFIEHNFNLGTLGARDAGSDAFLECFDFTQNRRAFTPIPTVVPAERLIRERPSGPPDDD